MSTLPQWRLISAGESWMERSQDGEWVSAQDSVTAIAVLQARLDNFQNSIARLEQENAALRQAQERILALPRYCVNELDDMLMPTRHVEGSLVALQLVLVALASPAAPEEAK